MEYLIIRGAINLLMVVRPSKMQLKCHHCLFSLTSRSQMILSSQSQLTDFSQNKDKAKWFREVKYHWAQYGIKKNSERNNGQITITLVHCVPIKVAPKQIAIVQQKLTHFVCYHCKSSAEKWHIRLEKSHNNAHFINI